MSESMFSSAAWKAGLPPFTPPSSSYCCQRSASISSAAARNRRIAASPLVSPPLPSASAVAVLPSGPRRVAPTPAAAPVARNDRRLTPPVDSSSGARTFASVPVGASRFMGLPSWVESGGVGESGVAYTTCHPYRTPLSATAYLSQQKDLRKVGGSG